MPRGGINSAKQNPEIPTVGPALPQAGNAIDAVTSQKPPAGPEKDMFHKPRGKGSIQFGSEEEAIEQLHSKKLV